MEGTTVGGLLSRDARARIRACESRIREFGRVVIRMTRCARVKVYQGSKKIGVR